MNVCVLVVSGVQFAVDDFVLNSQLTSKLSRYSLWHFGEPLRDGNHADSGFILDVSVQESKSHNELVERVITFLDDHFAELKLLMDYPGVESGVLDFSLNKRDVTVQHDRFPAALVRLAGDLGLWIDLTQYAG
jgi:hypothetical protein